MQAATNVPPKTAPNSDAAISPQPPRRGFENVSAPNAMAKKEKTTPPQPRLIMVSAFCAPMADAAPPKMTVNTAAMMPNSPEIMPSAAAVLFMIYFR